MPEKTPCPEVGIYENVPEELYRSWDCPSQSQLSLFRDPDRCELEVQYALDNPPESNDAMRLGTEVENALDGIQVHQNVKCLPDHIKVRRGKAWDEFKEGNPGIDWLPKSEYATFGEHIKQVGDIVASVKRHDLAMKLVDGAKRQVSFVWDAPCPSMSGDIVKHRVKGRLDYLKPGVIADLKTTSFGSQRRVGQWAWAHAWDIQAALYNDAMDDLLGVEHDFYFIVVRTSPPYVVTMYNGWHTTEAAGMFREIGRASYQITLERLAECRRTGEWNGYFAPDNPDSRVLDFQLPNYAG